jgi:hypothetical protein
MMLNYRLQVGSFSYPPGAQLPFVGETLFEQSWLVVNVGCPSTDVGFYKIPKPF